MDANIINQAGLVSAQGRAGAGPETAGPVMGNPPLCLIGLSAPTRTNFWYLSEPIFRHKNDVLNIHCPITFVGRGNISR